MTRRSPGGRCIDELPRSRPGIEIPNRARGSLKTQPAFLRPNSPAPEGAKPPEPQGPAACASLSSINNVKEPKPKTDKPKTADTNPPRPKPRSCHALCAEVDKASHPQRGAALGERYIGPSNRHCQANGGEKRLRGDGSLPAPARNLIRAAADCPVRQATPSQTDIRAFGVNQTETPAHQDCRRSTRASGQPLAE